MSMINVKKRNSSIELLKIFAMILIVLCHSVPCNGNPNNAYYFDFTKATNSISELTLIFFRYLGGIGNVIFFTCSAFFLIESKECKKDKVIKIIMDSFLISIGCLITYICLFDSNLDAKDIIIQFFPITFSNTWYITCYLLIYIIHPYLNKMINVLSQKELFSLCSIIFVLYFIINFLIKNNFFYNELICFIGIYLFIAYLKKYEVEICNNKRVNMFLIIFSIIMLILMILVTNYLGLSFTLFSDKVMHWGNICNPLILFIGIGLFNLFRQKDYYLKPLNYISSLTLIFYLIHENYLIRTFIKPSLYNIVYSSTSILFGTILFFVLILLIGVIFSFLYDKTLSKITNYLSSKISKVFTFQYDKLYSKYTKKRCNEK